MADTININGTEYRVAYNMRALLSYLKARGTDTVPETIGLEDKLLMMMSCLSEGERLEGRSFDVDILLDLAPADFKRVSADFDEIFIRQATPQVPDDGKKKE